MKKLILLVLALMGICATAQEKVRVHNGSESYVTTIEYVTFDVTAADDVVSVAGLKSENETLTGEKTTLEGKVSALTTEKAALQAELSAMDYALEERTTRHEYVDLGLPSKTLWATMNVGASSVEEYGDYFAWGEMVPHYSAGGNTNSPTWRKGCNAGYDWSTYFDTKDEGETFKKYNNDSGKTELENADNVAVKAWGGKWRIPTMAQQQELVNNCYWVWTTSYNGKSVNGYIVYKAKKIDDKGEKVGSGGTASSDYDVTKDVHIFLPAAGCRWKMSLNGAGDNGYYWSRSLDADYMDYASNLKFGSDDVHCGYNGRYNGQSVRPVCTK